MTCSIQCAWSAFLVQHIKNAHNRVNEGIAVTINTTSVTVKYLGVTITSDLKWSTHITNTCKLAKQKLELLYRQLSADWPENTITPVFKSWAESSVSNYRPISLLYTHSKLLEHIVVGSCTISSQTSSSPPDIMDSDQAAQPRRYSYNWNLDHSLTLAALFLDMSRAFDKIPHLHLLHSLSAVSTQGHYSNGWRDTFPIVPKKSISMATPSCSFWCPTRVHSEPSGIHHLHQLPGWTPLLPRDICHVLCKWHFTVLTPLYKPYDSTIFQLDVDLVSDWITLDHQSDKDLIPDYLQESYQTSVIMYLQQGNLKWTWRW